jgi:hypothetical protein
MADSRTFSAMSARSKAHIQDRQKRMQQWRAQRKKTKQPGLAPEAPDILEASDQGQDLSSTPEVPTLAPPETNVATAQHPEGENVSQPGYQGPPKPDETLAPWSKQFEPTTGQPGSSGVFIGPGGVETEATPENIEAARTINFDTKTGVMHGDITTATPGVPAPDVQASTPSPTPIGGGHILHGEQLNPLTAGNSGLLANAAQAGAAQGQRDFQASRLGAEAGLQTAAENYRQAAPGDKAAAMQGYRNALLEKQAFGDLITSGEQGLAQERMMEQARAQVESDPGVARYRKYLMEKGVDPFSLAGGTATITETGKLDILNREQEQASKYQAESASKAWAAAKTRAQAYRDAYNRDPENNAAYLDYAEQELQKAKEIAELSGGVDPTNPKAGFDVDNSRRVMARRQSGNESVRRAEKAGLVPQGTADADMRNHQKLQQVKQEYVAEEGKVKTAKEEKKTKEGGPEIVQGRQQEQAEPQKEARKLSPEEEEDAKLRRLVGNQRMRNFLGLPQYNRQLVRNNLYA